MSSEFTISERLSSAGREQMFANNCLKRKLEVVGRNGFSATEHDMTFQDHDCSLRSEVGSFNFEKIMISGKHKNIVYQIFVCGPFTSRSTDLLISSFCFEVYLSFKLTTLRERQYILL